MAYSTEMAFRATIFISLWAFFVLIQICVTVTKNRPHPADYFKENRASAYYGYVIDHPDLCRSDDGDVKLVMMVHSAANHFKTRTTIRQTWGSVTRRTDVALAFVLGMPTNPVHQPLVLQEDRLYGDIVQGDFLDTYHNLTLKSISMIRWVHDRCRSAMFVLKIDDDCFLNPYGFLEYLDSKNHTAAIYGKVYHNAQPFREIGSKWYMPKDQYTKFRYPTFVMGPSYVVSQAAVPLLHSAIETTKPIVLEDVYLNGLCAEKVGISRVDDKRFYAEGPPSVCDARKIFTYHDLNRNDIGLLWWFIHDTTGNQCNNTSDTAQIEALNAILSKGIK